MTITPRSINWHFAFFQSQRLMITKLHSRLLFYPLAALRNLSISCTPKQYCKYSKFLRVPGLVSTSPSPSRAFSTVLGGCLPIIIQGISQSRALALPSLFPLTLAEKGSSPVGLGQTRRGKRRRIWWVTARPPAAPCTQPLSTFTSHGTCCERELDPWKGCVRPGSTTH